MRRHFLGGCLLICLASVGGTAGASDASKGEDLLRSRHLQRVKSLYVLTTAEEEALGKLDDFRAAYDAYFKAQNRSDEFEQAEQMLKATNAELSQVSRQASSLRGRAGSLSRRNRMQAQQSLQARSMLPEVQEYEAQLKAQLNELKTRQPKGDDKKNAAADLKKTKDEWTAQLRVARDALDPVINQYRELSHDRDVKLALEAIRVENKTLLKVAPSRKFLEAVKLVEGSKAAAHVLSPTHAPRSNTSANP